MVPSFYIANKGVNKDFLPCKDRIPSHLCSSIVYNLHVVAAYYGTASRHFIVRCRGHLGINKSGKAIKVFRRPLETMLVALAIALL